MFIKNNIMYLSGFWQLLINTLHECKRFKTLFFSIPIFLNIPKEETCLNTYCESVL